jgi:site-specific DNA-methyltransferase (adenine-specific)
LVKDHIISWTNPGDLIFDPFMGSGTTARAAVQTERNYLGSEIPKEYHDICVKRLEVK